MECYKTHDGATIWTCNLPLEEHDPVYKHEDSIHKSWWLDETQREEAKHGA